MFCVQVSDMDGLSVFCVQILIGWLVCILCAGSDKNGLTVFCVQVLIRMSCLCTGSGQDGFYVFCVQVLIRMAHLHSVCRF